jgi:hypothetical protein
VTRSATAQLHCGLVESGASAQRRHWSSAQDARSRDRRGCRSCRATRRKNLPFAPVTPFGL